MLIMKDIAQLIAHYSGIAYRGICIEMRVAILKKTDSHEPAFQNLKFYLKNLFQLISKRYRFHKQPSSQHKHKIKHDKIIILTLYLRSIDLSPYIHIPVKESIA